MGIEAVEYLCKSLGVICEGCYGMGYRMRGSDGVKYCGKCGREADKFEIIRNNSHENNESKL